MIHRRTFIAGVAAVVVPAPALAHHGWGWTEGENVVLAGVIRSVRLGNPHGLVEIEDERGAIWTVELGQPWRHARAGLPDDRLAPGVEIVVEGQRSADPDERRVKAERVVLDGMRYNLYPDRS